MIGELLEPDAQKDPHHWASTFGGHAWIGLGPWGIVAVTIDMWTAAWVVPLVYLICWEGLQWYLAKERTKALFWDCILDATAVAFGCMAATLACHGVKLDDNTYRMMAVACWAASVGVAVTGWKVRG